MAVSIYDVVTAQRNDTSSGAPLTFAVDVYGENRALVVVTSPSRFDDDLLNIGSVKLGDIEFVQRLGDVYSEMRLEVWTLWNPPIGTNTITITPVTSQTIANIFAAAFVLNGAQQTGFPDSSNYSHGISTTPSLDITTVKDNCLIISAILSETTVTGVGDQTQQCSLTDSYHNFVCATYNPMSPAGTKTLNFTKGAFGQVLAAIAIAPIEESITTYINAVDRSDYIINHSISITDEINSKVNTCSFKTYDTSGTYVPSNSDSVIIYDTSGEKIFAGVVSKITEKRVGIDPTTGTEMLQYSVDCQDYTRILQRKLVVETYESKTCKQIIQEMIDKYFPTDGFTLTNTEDGPTIAQISFNYKSADKALDALASAAGYNWFVDYDKDIHFFLVDSLTSVMTLTDTTDNWTNLVITPDVTQLRNRVFIRGGIYYSDPYTQSIKADGTQEEFILAYTPDSVGFSVTISSVAKSVGIDNVDDEDAYDFMLNRKEKALKMGNSAWAQANTPIANGTVLEVIYSYEIPVLITQEDTDSINAMRSLEGGDGVYEHVIVDENITSISAARERAAAELRDYANAIVKGSFDSYDAQGIKSGDIITINSTRRGINTDYLVQTVKISMVAHNKLKYAISFSGRLYGLVDVLIALFKQSQSIVLGKDEVLDAFNGYTDFTLSSYDTTPVETVSAPPFKWSDDAGTTTNKGRWNLAEWD